MTPKRTRDTAASGDASDASTAKRQQRVRSTIGGASSAVSGDNNSGELSASDSTADDSLSPLRISNELLRSENKQLHVDVEILEEDNRKLKDTLAASQQRVQVLESDLARWYKTQKRAAELKQAEHAAEITKLQHLLDALAERSDLSLGTASATAMRLETEPRSMPVQETAVSPASSELPLDDVFPPAVASESVPDTLSKPTAGMRYKKRASVPSSLRLDGSKNHALTSHFVDKTCDFCCKLCIASDIGSHTRIGNKTRYCCLVCDANLCKVKRWESRSKSCFDLWHSQADFVKLRCRESSRWSVEGELQEEGERSQAGVSPPTGQRRRAGRAAAASRGNRRDGEEKQKPRRTRSRLG